MRPHDFFRAHPAFTTDEAAGAFAQEGTKNPRAVESFLRRHVAAGDITRLRRGLYLSNAREGRVGIDPFVLTSALATDATIAYHAALEWHGKAYSIWFRYLFLTAKKPKPLKFDGRDFIPVAPPRAVRTRKDFGGYVEEQPHAGGLVRVTSLERTLVDVMDRPDLGGGWEEIWRSLESVEFFKLSDVVEYALKLGSAIAIARAGFFLEQHKEALFVTDEHLQPLRAKRPRQARYFDERREDGRLLKEWNLIVPERIMKRTWEEEQIVDA